MYRIGQNHCKFRPLNWLVLTILAASSINAVADELRIAVASNFAGALEQLSPVFQAATGHEIIVIPGSSGRLYAQIINGAPFDIFMSADAERPQSLADRKFGSVGIPETYAIGRLVLWSPNAVSKDEVMDQLLSGGFNHLSLANPRVAPYGAAAMEVLVNLQMANAVPVKKMVMGESITQAYQFVATGNADLGFVALAQLLEISPESYWLVPADMHSSIIQNLIVLRASLAASDFIDFMNTETARAIIAAAGYDLPHH